LWFRLHFTKAAALEFMCHWVTGTVMDCIHDIIGVHGTFGLDLADDHRRVKAALPNTPVWNGRSWRPFPEFADAAVHQRVLRLFGMLAYVPDDDRSASHWCPFHVSHGLLDKVRLHAARKSGSVPILRATSGSFWSMRDWRRNRALVTRWHAGQVPHRSGMLVSRRTLACVSWN